MRVSLNYVTFKRDFKWLEYSLESFRRYCSGFSEVVIVVPTTDLDLFLPLEKRFSTPECPVWIKTFLEYPGKGFVHHLAMKCYADVFSPSADFVFHMDPDCLFKAKQTPADYFVDGRPILVIEPYDEILKAGHHPRYHWKSVTEMALGFECKYETMCRHPAVHPRETYVGLRNHIEVLHRTPFIDFVIKQQNKFPQGFGEFNSLGAWALRASDKHHYIDRGSRGEAADPIPLIWQGWSYTGVDSDKNRQEIKQILGC